MYMYIYIFKELAKLKKKKKKTLIHEINWFLKRERSGAKEQEVSRRTSRGDVACEQAGVTISGNLF